MSKTKEAAPSKNGKVEEKADPLAGLAESDGNPRKAVLTIEVTTTLSHKELMDVQSLVFGQIRRTRLNQRSSRQTIQRTVPKWAGHDTAGVITQVQVNVVGRR